MFENVVSPRLHVKHNWVQPITNLPVANNILDIRSDKEELQLKESLEQCIRTACHEDGEAAMPDLLLWDEITRRDYGTLMRSLTLHTT